eukprot:403343557
MCILLHINLIKGDCDGDIIDDTTEECDLPDNKQECLNCVISEGQNCINKIDEETGSTYTDYCMPDCYDYEDVFEGDCIPASSGCTPGCSIQKGYFCKTLINNDGSSSGECYKISLQNVGGEPIILNSCTKLSALFETTSNFIDTEATQYYNVNQCPSPLQDGLCFWERKLAIKCFVDSEGYQMIRVQTNSMPDHQHKADAFYSAAYGKVQSPSRVDLDVCLGTATGTGFYHYYSFSPCILFSEVKSSVVQIRNAKATQTCIHQLTSMVYKFIRLQLVLQEMTTLLYHHIRHGKISGNPVTMMLVMGLLLTISITMWHQSRKCNLLMFHPYTVGCWGPAYSIENGKFPASCSNKPRICTEQKGYAHFGLSTISAILILFMSLIMINI